MLYLGTEGQEAKEGLGWARGGTVPTRFLCIRDATRMPVQNGMHGMFGDAQMSL